MEFTFWENLHKTVNKERKRANYIEHGSIKLYTAWQSIENVTENKKEKSLSKIKNAWAVVTVHNSSSEFRTTIFKQVLIK